MFLGVFWSQLSHPILKREYLKQGGRLFSEESKGFYGVYKVFLKPELRLQERSSCFVQSFRHSLQCVHAAPGLGGEEVTS